MLVVVVINVNAYTFPDFLRPDLSNECYNLISPEQFHAQITISAAL